jgi:hypothetical protein
MKENPWRYSTVTDYDNSYIYPEGGYTLVKLPRTVTYRDSVYGTRDSVYGTRDHLTYQKLVTQ